MEMSVSSVVLTVMVLPVTVNSEAEADSSLLDEESLPRLHRRGGTNPSVVFSTTDS